MSNEQLGVPIPGQAPTGEQARAAWLAAVMAPLRREAVPPEPSADADNIPPETSDDGGTAVAEAGSQPVGLAAETAGSGNRRQRAVGRSAVTAVLANVYHDPIRHTVTLLMDEPHATAVIYAVRVLAADYEAHAREVRTVAATLSADSYGAQNRHFIAIRHERIASRLRQVESNYRAEVEEGLPAE